MRNTNVGFADSVRTLSNQIEERRKHVATEEAVKQALILPFIGLLGFDIYNPAELIPEYKAGWAKVTEKVDYCVQIHGKPILFFEAKGPSEMLVSYDAQLAKYFNSTPEIKFAIITNGVEYRFFTDLQEPNILDKKPFFEFDFSSFTDADLDVLERFRKDVFNAENLVGYAEDLVFQGALKGWFKKLLREPSDEFISFAVKDAGVTETRVTQKVIDRFRPLVKDSISAAVLEIVQQSLTPQAASLEPAIPAQEEIVAPIATEVSRVVTTEEEMQAFGIIRDAVAATVPDTDAIKYNDTASYFAVQYNVTTRWFVRLWIQDRETKMAVVRISTDRARELVPSAVWEDAPGGGARTSFTSVEELVALNPAYIEAVQAVAS
jgi:predicted type IV restriction endonuclease